MKKKVVTSIVVGSIIAQSTIPMYAEGIQKVNPYNLETAVSQEEIQSLSAKVEGIDGFASMILLATGELNSDTVKSPVPGYDFVCVKVGNTQIKSIGTYQDPESEKYLWYYSTDGVNATIFDDNSINQITAVFEKHVETYNVNYSFDESIIGVDGPKTVREGNDLSFTINVLDPNYEISSVTVNDVDYTERLNKNTLTIPADEITGNLDITINNAEITEFDVLYDDNFLMNGSVSGDQPTQVKKGGT